MSKQEEKKDVEIKESLSIEDMKKLEVVDTNKLEELFGKIQEEIKTKAMPEGGAIFVAIRFPNKGKETSTFLVNLNGVETEIIDLFSGVMRQDPSFSGMMRRALAESSNPFEELLDALKGFGDCKE